MKNRMVDRLFYGLQCSRFVVFIVLGSLALSSVQAKSFLVNSSSSFNTAQDKAAAGDTIVWQNGTYSDVSISVDINGIVVRAETAGSVTFNGSSTSNITGNNITFSGFQFVGGDIGSGYIMTITGSNDILTQLNFSGYLAKKYISIEAGTQYDEISYCNFENKPVAAVIGCTIQINAGATVGYHKIRYCSFQNYPGNGGDNGNEPIRIGLGSESTYNSRTIVEYCYFNNTGLGDSETISVKCCENVIRYCTNDNNPEGMFVFRNGDRNVAYGNFFINGSGGIRIKEAIDSYCYNNYFETSGVSGDMNAITIVYVSPKPSNVYFYNNTFVDCGNIDLGGTGPANVWFANNIFKKSSGAIFQNANNQTTWIGNIYTGTPGISISSGMTQSDPLLVKNSDGYYGITAGSPAIDHSDTNYPAVLDIASLDDDPSILRDISGRSRPVSKLLKDVGCTEYNASGSTINTPLKLAAVGPVYLRTSDVKAEKSLPLSKELLQNYPNPFNPNTKITFSVPRDGFATVSVYSATGEKITVLFNGFASADKMYTANFNAASLSSGVYMLCMDFHNQRTIRKMMLLK